MTIDAVRDWVGSSPDDETIHDTLGRHNDDVHLAAQTILRRRRADMVANPAQWGVDGDYSQRVMDFQLAALDAQLERLAVLTDDTVDAVGVLTQTPICGPSLQR